jgi:hypothetical protein
MPFQIENMMHEVKHSKIDDTGNLVDEINFEDFIWLYINHRPAFAVPADKLKKAFNIFAEEVKENSVMTRDTFIKTLQEKGIGCSNSSQICQFTLSF